MNKNKELTRAIDASNVFVCKDSTRPSISCLRIEHYEDMIKLIATDALSLSIATYKTTFKPATKLAKAFYHISLEKSKQLITILKTMVDYKEEDFLNEFIDFVLKNDLGNNNFPDYNLIISDGRPVIHNTTCDVLLLSNQFQDTAMAMKKLKVKYIETTYFCQPEVGKITKPTEYALYNSVDDVKMCVVLLPALS